MASDFIRFFKKYEFKTINLLKYVMYIRSTNILLGAQRAQIFFPSPGLGKI